MARKTNPRFGPLVKSMYELSEEQKNSMWKTVAKSMEKASANWAKINLSRLNRITSKGETVIVLGNVLGSGSLDHNLNVYAFRATEGAKQGIENSKGSFGLVEELVAKKSKSKGIRLIK